MATEKRLIDADKLVTTIQGTESEVARNAPYDAEWFGRLADRQFEILEMIDNAPTVDAVEVTRCKGCEHYDPLNIRPFVGTCDTWNTVVRESGFCHHGERKNDGN